MMSEIQILMGFIVVAVVFTWVSVQKVTKANTNIAADRAFIETVLPKLLELHGETTNVNGLTVRILPAHIQASVNKFLSR